MSLMMNLRPAGLRGSVVALVAMLAVLAGGASIAQDVLQREGYFEVRSASTVLDDGVHELDARLQLVLSSEALEALNKSLALTIELQIQVIRVRRLYMDALQAELAVRFELKYDQVTQRYIVRNLNSGDQDSFATLYSALNNLGRVQELPVIYDTLLDPDREYRVRVRAMLQTERLPAPLRLLTFWRSQWQLQSEWFEWLLER